MNPNSSTQGSDDPSTGFRQYSQQEMTMGFNQFHPSWNPQQFSYQQLLQEGFVPANFPLPPPAFNTQLRPPFNIQVPPAFNTQVPPVMNTQIPPTQPVVEEEEFVSETQPELLKSQATGSGTSRKKFQNRAKASRWTPEEEEALAKAWVNVSEDSKRGNSQKSDTFWNRVLELFSMQMGSEYRTHHQLCSKYKDMNLKVNKFNGIYNNLLNTRSSGTNEADILQTAHFRYREDNNGAAFVHEKAWEVLRLSVKWKQTKPMKKSSSSRAAKRSKTSESLNDTTEGSDAHWNVDGGDEEEEEEEYEHPRPIGRDKAKRAQSSGSGAGSQETVNTLFSKMDAFNAEHKAAAEAYRLKKLQLKQEKNEIEKHKMFNEDFTFYTTPHDHLTGHMLKVTLQRKEMIKKKYNFED